MCGNVYNVMTPRVTAALRVSTSEASQGGFCEREGEMAGKTQRRRQDDVLKRKRKFIKELKQTGGSLTERGFVGVHLLLHRDPRSLLYLYIYYILKYLLLFVSVAFSSFFSLSFSFSIA